MKRPQGFDKPETPAAESSRQPAAKAPRRGLSRASKAAAADAATPPVAPPAAGSGLSSAHSPSDGTTVLPSLARPASAQPQRRVTEPAVSPAGAAISPPAFIQPSPGASSAAFADARSQAKTDARPGGLPTAWWTAKNDVPAASDHTVAPELLANSGERRGVPSDAATEPIDVVAATPPAPVSDVHAQTVSATGEITGPLAPVTLLSTAAHPIARERPVRDPAGNERSTSTIDDADEATPSTGSARARLRAATRARKAYERAEVRRFTKHLRRRRAVWIGAVGSVLALAIFVAVGTFSPLMALTTIQIEGASRLDPSEVSTALSGQIGTPLPLVDLGEIKNELSQFTLIQSFATESRPPNTLVVRIIERDPIGAIAGAAGFDLVDPAGVVIQSSAERPAGYPLIEAASTEGLAAAGAVIQALPADVRAQLDAVVAASTDNVQLRLAGGASVAWGSAEESAQKALVLAQLMGAAPPSGVSLYDVSSPASPVVR